MTKWVAMLLTTSMGAAMAQDDVISKAVAEKGAVKTESGMVYRSLTEGKGASPKATDTVQCTTKERFPTEKNSTVLTSVDSRPNFP